MSRRLQHITTLSDRAEAEREGVKITALCGKRVYPMPRMKPEIPTCTPCNREVLRLYAEAITEPVATKTSAPSATWTWLKMPGATP